MTPEKKEVVLGEPTWATFRRREHDGQELGVDVGGRSGNRLGRPNCITVTVKGADGKKVAEPDGGRDMGGIPTLVRLPTDGSHTFTLVLPYWATFDSPGESTVAARRNLSLVLLALPVEGKRPVNSRLVG